MHLKPSLETHVQGYVASWELILCILAAWKCDFCRVVKPMLQGYVASCEHIFSFMSTSNCDSFNSRSKLKVHAKSPILRPGTKVNVKHERHIAWAHFVHFGALKIHLLPSLETHDQGYLASRELIFCILAAYICDFFRFVKPMLQGLALFVHFDALKIHLLPSLETHFQGYVASCELIFFILAAWKCNICRVVKPMLQGYVASCKHIFSFIATWKCEF